MSQTIRVLLLEDRPADAELVLRELRQEGLQTEAKCVATEPEFLAQLRDFAPDLVLADYSLPGYGGLSALASVLQEFPATPFIFVSGSLGEEIATEALHHGATDYVIK
jgi:CheY-like chemotaxis protein